MATTVKAWLRAQHDNIMKAEQDALALMKSGDIAGYNAKMHEKATLLANLASAAETQLENLNPVIQARLAQFSASAATALDLGSVFYMSALLYPDEHKPGEPDNFQKLIDSLA